MNGKYRVVVSRHWLQPNIEIYIEQNGIVMGIGLGDFVRALAIEIGSPAMIFKRKTLEDRVISAAERVIEKVKSESNRA
jgi:hypothetical protein